MDTPRSGRYGLDVQPTTVGHLGPKAPHILLGDLCVPGCLCVEMIAANSHQTSPLSRNRGPAFVVKHFDVDPGRDQAPIIQGARLGRWTPGGRSCWTEDVRHSSPWALSFRWLVIGA